MACFSFCNNLTDGERVNNSFCIQTFHIFIYVQPSFPSLYSNSVVLDSCKVICFLPWKIVFKGIEFIIELLLRIKSLWYFHFIQIVGIHLSFYHVRPWNLLFFCVRFWHLKTFCCEFLRLITILALLLLLSFSKLSIL